MKAPEYLVRDAAYLFQAVARVHGQADYYARLAAASEDADPAFARALGYCAQALAEALRLAEHALRIGNEEA